MADTRLSLLIAKVLRKYHLSTTDIADATTTLLFNDVLAEYSRFRGLRAQQAIEKESGVAAYDLESDVQHIITVLWNDTHPDGTLLTTGFSDEDYHHPSLPLIKDIKLAAERAAFIETDQEWRDYYDGDDHKINLDPIPTTNIYVIYRKLFTNTTYPANDEKVLQNLLEAYVLRHCQSTGIVATIGDIRLEQRRMDEMIAERKREFYLVVNPMQVSNG